MDALRPAHRYCDKVPGAESGAEKERRRRFSIRHGLNAASRRILTQVANQQIRLEVLTSLSKGFFG